MNNKKLYVYHKPNVMAKLDMDIELDEINIGE